MQPCIYLLQSNGYLSTDCKIYLEAEGSFSPSKLPPEWKVSRQKSTGDKIFLLLATAHTFGWYITRLGVPAKVSTLILDITGNKLIILALINLFLLIIGMFMDILPAVLILVPVLAPAMQQVGIHPLHFALILLVNLNIGMITRFNPVEIYST